jgi:transposase
MINELIFRKFGVLYNPRYLPTLLKNMKLSYQKASNPRSPHPISKNQATK